MRSEHQTVWILIILVGLIWVQNVCKAEDIMTELNVTILINAINYYLLWGSEPDCLFMSCKNVRKPLSKVILILSLEAIITQ